MSSLQSEMYALPSGRKGENRELSLVSAVSHLFLPQNNLYAKVAYFGVAYLIPFIGNNSPAIS